MSIAPHAGKDVTLLIQQNPDEFDWLRDVFATAPYLGNVTQGTHRLIFRNTLTGHEVAVSPPRELTLGDILERYVCYENWHHEAYALKHVDRYLDRSETLKDNGIDPSEQSYLESLGIDANEFTPTISMIFVDDLNEL